MGIRKGLALYEFTNSNPIVLVDRHGLEPATPEQVNAAITGANRVLDTTHGIDRSGFEAVAFEAQGGRIISPGTGEVINHTQSFNEGRHALRNARTALRNLDLCGVQLSRAVREEYQATLRGVEGRLSIAETVFEALDDLRGNYGNRLQAFQLEAFSRDMGDASRISQRLSYLGETLLPGEHLNSLWTAVRSVGRPLRGYVVLPSLQDAQALGVGGLKLLGHIVTGYGAHLQAKESYDDTRGDPYAAYVITFTAALAAGAVDNAMFASEVAAPVVMDSWETEGFGPTQRFVGTALREANQWYEKQVGLRK
jgi:hypothetical protein